MATKKVTTTLANISDLAFFRWQAQLKSTVDSYYTVPDLAKWLDVAQPTLEDALRSDARFLVTAADRMPEKFVRLERPGGGYWPYIRLRTEAELAVAMSEALTRQDAARHLTDLITRATGPANAEVPITVSWDEGRAGFIVRGITPEHVVRVAHAAGERDEAVPEAVAAEA